MEKYTLESFKKESTNDRFSGGYPLIDYELTDYKQTDKDVTVTVNFKMNMQSLEDDLYYEEYNKFFDKYGAANVSSYSNGFVTFTIDIDYIDERGSNYIDLGGTEPENIIKFIKDGKISLIKIDIDDEDLNGNTLTEQDKKIIEETVKEIYQTKSKDLLAFVVASIQLWLKEPKK